MQINYYEKHQQHLLMAFLLWPRHFSSEELLKLINDCNDISALQDLSFYINSGYFNNPSKFEKIDLLKKFTSYFNQMFSSNKSNDYFEKVNSIINENTSAPVKLQLRGDDRINAITYVRYTKEFKKLTQALTSKIERLNSSISSPATKSKIIKLPPLKLALILLNILFFGNKKALAATDKPSDLIQQPHVHNSLKGLTTKERELLSSYSHEAMEKFILEGSDTDELSPIEKLNYAIIVDNKELLDAMIQSDLNLNEYNKSLSMDLPLIIACQYGRINMLEALIKAGADINAHGINDRNALFEAIAAKQPVIVEYLIAQGINVLSYDKGMLPLCYAIYENDFWSAKLIHQAMTKKQLTTKKFNTYKRIIQEISHLQSDNSAKSEEEIALLTDLAKSLSPETLYDRHLIGLISFHKAYLNKYFHRYMRALEEAEKAIENLVPRISIYDLYNDIANTIIPTLSDQESEKIITKYIRIYDKGLEDFPNNKKLSLKLLKMLNYSNNKQYASKALSLAKRLESMRVDSEEVYRTIGHHYLKLRQYQTAYQNFQKALTMNLNDSNLVVLTTSLRYLCEEKNTAKYISKHEWPNAIDRTEAYPVYNELFCETTQNFDTDLILIKNPIHINFDYHVANNKFKMAIEAYKNKRFIDSVNNLKEVLELVPLDDPYFNPPLATVYGFIGLNLFQNGDNITAVKYLRRSIILAPDLSKIIPFIDAYARAEQQLGSITTARKADLQVKTLCQKNSAVNEDLCLRGENKLLKTSQLEVNKVKKSGKEDNENFIAPSDSNEYNALLITLASIFGGVTLFYLCYILYKKCISNNPSGKSTKSDLLSLDKEIAPLKSLFDDFYTFTYKANTDCYMMSLRSKMPTLPDNLQTAEIKSITIDQMNLLDKTLSMINALLKNTASLKDKTIIFPKPSQVIAQKMFKRNHLWQVLLEISVEAKRNSLEKKYSLLSQTINSLKEVKTDIIKQSIDIKAMIQTAADLSESNLKDLKPSERRLSACNDLEKYFQRLNEKKAALSLFDKENQLNELPGINNSSAQNVDDELINAANIEKQLLQIQKKYASTKNTLVNIGQEISDLVKKINFSIKNFAEERKGFNTYISSIFASVLADAFAEINRKNLEVRKKEDEKTKAQKLEEKEKRVMEFKRKLAEQNKKKQEKNNSNNKIKMKQNNNNNSFFKLARNIVQTKPEQQLLQVAIDQLDFMNTMINNSGDLATSDDVRNIIILEGFQECIFKLSRSLNISRQNFSFIDNLITHKSDYSKVANVLIHDYVKFDIDVEKLQACAKLILNHFIKPLSDLKNGSVAMQAQRVDLLANFLPTTLVIDNANKVVTQYEQQCMQGILVQLDVINEIVDFYKAGTVKSELLETALDSALFVIRCKSRCNLVTDLILKRYGVIDDYLHFQSGKLTLKEELMISKLVSELKAALSTYKITPIETNLYTLLHDQKFQKKSFTHSLFQLSEPDSFRPIEYSYIKVCLERMMPSLQKLSLLSDYIIKNRLSEKGYHSYFNDGPIQCAMKMLIAKIGQLIKILPHGVADELTKEAPAELLIKKGKTYFAFYRDKLGHNFAEEAYAMDYAIFEDIFPEQLFSVSKQASAFLYAVEKYCHLHFPNMQESKMELKSTM